MCAFWPCTPNCQCEKNGKNVRKTMTLLSPTISSCLLKITCVYMYEFMYEAGSIITGPLRFDLQKIGKADSAERRTCAEDVEVL